MTPVDFSATPGCPGPNPRTHRGIICGDDRRLATRTFVFVLVLVFVVVTSAAGLPVATAVSAAATATVAAVCVSQGRLPRTAGTLG